MSDIFISYARSAASHARVVAETLRADGYSVWWDDDLPNHRAYSDVIEEQLTTAKGVVVIWSAEAVKSEWVRSEANRAREDHKLVQVNVDGARLPMPFDQTQCADLGGWSGNADAAAWIKVVSSVAELVGRAATDAPNAGAPKPPRPRSAPTARADRPRPRWMIWAAVGVVLAGAVGASAWWFFGRTAGPAAPVRVAVEPFEASGPGTDARTLADALDEDVTSALTANQVDTLSPEASAALRGADGEAQAAKLGVGLVSTGTVRSDGKTLDVQFRLEDPVHHAVLWSTSYTGPVTDTDGLRVSAADRISGVIIYAARPENHLLRTHPDLMALYLAARISDDSRLLNESRHLALARAFLARAPQFSQAHSLLARWLLSYAGGTLRFSPAAQSAAIAESDREARKALALDPRDGDAYYVLAELSPLSAWGQRENLMQKAVALFPGYHATYSDFLLGVGRARDALTEGQQALAASPYDGAPRFVLARAEVATGQEQAGAARLVELRRIWPQNFGGMAEQLRLTTLMSPPDYAVGRNIVADPLFTLAVGPLTASVWSKVYGALASGGSADKKAAAALLLSTITQRIDVSSDDVVALVGLGDLDDAFALANRAASPEVLQQPSGLGNFVTSTLFMPATDPMRRDPRFMPLMKKFGLLDYWRSTGHWPDFCAPPGLPYDCKAETARLASAPA